VKLTTRGEDFLIGTLLATAISTIASQFIFLALTFALSVAAASSLLLFLSRDPAKLPVKARPELVRLRKGQNAPVELTVGRGSSGWLTLSSALAPSAPGLSFDGGDQRGKFMVGAKYAGRYEGLSLRAKFVDVLALFEKTEDVRPERFVIEVLPLSLLEPPLRPNLLTIAYGEAPAGARGGGQEFYSLEAYTGAQESRDIMWRRVARSPDQTISTRVREANIPGLVTVALVESSPIDRSVWMDAATEAMGRIGVTLTDLGIALEVVVPPSDNAPLQATNSDELADLLMEMWKEVRAGVAPSVSQVPLGPVLIGSNVLSDQTMSDLTNRNSTFVVPDGSPWDRAAEKGLNPGADSIDAFIRAVILS